MFGTTDEINFNILKTFGLLSQAKNGWAKELNLISWNGRDAKLDIRDWAPRRAKMSKGVTLNRGEAERLLMLLGQALAAANADAESAANTGANAGAKTA